MAEPKVEEEARSSRRQLQHQRAKVRTLMQAATMHLGPEGEGEGEETQRNRQLQQPSANLGGAEHLAELRRRHAQAMSEQAVGQPPSRGRGMRAVVQ